VFRDTSRRRAISLIGRRSERCNRRISAQSSTLITLQEQRRGQFSLGTRGSVFSRQRQGPSRLHRGRSRRLLAAIGRRSGASAVGRLDRPTAGGMGGDGCVYIGGRPSFRHRQGGVVMGLQDRGTPTVLRYGIQLRIDPGVWRFVSRLAP
jgi:hypothetical protein